MGYQFNRLLTLTSTLTLVCYIQLLFSQLYLSNKFGKKSFSNLAHTAHWVTVYRAVGLSG